MPSSFSPDVQLEHLPCCHRATFTCASPVAAPNFDGSNYVLTYVGQTLRDQRRVAAVLASERPAAEVVTPLALCVPQVREWANTVGPRRFGSATIFIIDRYGSIDMWDEGRGGFTPVDFPGQPDRSVESLVRAYRGGLALWVQHTTSIGLLDGDADNAMSEATPAPARATSSALPRNAAAMVGAGATILHGNALTPATIYRIEREGRRVGVRRDLVDEVLQYARHQSFAFVPHPLSPLEWFERTGDDEWQSEQRPRLGLHIGTRNMRASGAPE